MKGVINPQGARQLELVGDGVDSTNQLELADLTGRASFPDSTRKGISREDNHTLCSGRKEGTGLRRRLAWDLVDLRGALQG